MERCTKQPSCYTTNKDVSNGKNNSDHRQQKVKYRAEVMKDLQLETESCKHRQQGRQTVYQRRSGDRLFRTGDHIGLVVDLERQSGQTGR